MHFERIFAMPNGNTFSLPPVARLLDRWLEGAEVIVDPFARNAMRGTIRNDLNPDTAAQYHLPAEEFVGTLESEIADVVLFDPPYSPRQISEMYQQIGKPCSMRDTQNARLYKSVKDGLHRVLRPGGVAICMGWNTMGFGLTRGYEMLEVLLVPHGAAHNDTLVTVERKIVPINAPRDDDPVTSFARRLSSIQIPPNPEIDAAVEDLFSDMYGSL